MDHRVREATIDWGSYPIKELPYINQLLQRIPEKRSGEPDHLALEGYQPLLGQHCLQLLHELGLPVVLGNWNKKYEWFIV